MLVMPLHQGDMVGKVDNPSCILHKFVLGLRRENSSVEVDSATGLKATRAEVSKDLWLSVDNCDNKYTQCTFSDTEKIWMLPK